jgi:hypothetical protein
MKSLLNLTVLLSLAAPAALGLDVNLIRDDGQETGLEGLQQQS